MKRILVGVDGSAESKQAAELAARLAAAFHATVTLAHVVPTRVPLGPERHGVCLGDLDENQRAYGNALLRELAARCADAGARIETRLDFGPPAERLAALAEAGGFDAVAVGHRGRGAVQRVLLGSVADRLAQISRKPVLVWRGSCGHDS